MDRDYIPDIGISFIPVSTYLTPPAPGYHRSCSISKLLQSCVESATHVISILLNVLDRVVCRPS